MKGFGIYVKNDLLDPKHAENMGVSVWLYMWCLDKMTSINEEGIGKVLGGKPIKYEEVFKDLGVSMRTYRRWMAILSSKGYVNVKHAPYGIIITVNKAVKKFGKRMGQPGEKPVDNQGELGRKWHTSRPKMAHLSAKNGTPNKTTQYDNTEDTTINTKDTASHEATMKRGEGMRSLSDLLPKR